MVIYPWGKYPKTVADCKQKGGFKPELLIENGNWALDLGHFLRLPCSWLWVGLIKLEFPKGLAPPCNCKSTLKSLAFFYTVYQLESAALTTQWPHLGEHLCPQQDTRLWLPHSLWPRKHTCNAHRTQGPREGPAAFTSGKDFADLKDTECLQLSWELKSGDLQKNPLSCWHWGGLWGPKVAKVMAPPPPPLFSFGPWLVLRLSQNRLNSSEIILSLCVAMPLHGCGGQRETLWFTPPTWALGTDLRSSGL